MTAFAHRFCAFLPTAVLCIAAAVPVSAQVAPVETDDTGSGESFVAVPTTSDDTDAPASAFATFEHHGYFRFRFNTFSRMVP